MPIQKSNSQRSIQFDPATAVRVAWLAHALAQELRLKRSEVQPTTLVRRAVDAYVVHVETLLAREDDLRDLARNVERQRIRTTCRGEDLGVTLGDVQGTPLRPLSELMRDHRARQPRPIDTLMEDMKQWQQ